MGVSNTAVIGCIIGLFVLIIVCTIAIVVMLCVSSRVSSSYGKEEQVGRGNHQHRTVNLLQDFLGHSCHHIDLENQNQSQRSQEISSTVGLKSFPLSSLMSVPTGVGAGNQGHVSADGGLLVTISREEGIPEIGGGGGGGGGDGSAAEESDYRSAIESFHTITDGLDDRKIRLKKSNRRMTSVHYKRINDVNHTLQTIVAVPNERKQSYLADQYDSFSRTLMLQNLIQTSVNDPQLAILKVRDPFSDSLISVGGIVVVVKPFHGTEEYEFNNLETGDLLRIVKFFVKEDDDDAKLSIKPLRIISEKLAKENTEPDDNNQASKPTMVDNAEEITINGYSEEEEIFVDKSDANYGKLYCTGIILNTCLEFNNDNNDLSLRIKDGVDSNSDLELLKDFPLEIVSLETTVLRSMNDYTLSGRSDIDDSAAECI